MGVRQARARRTAAVAFDATAPQGLGDHPWNTRPPFVLDTSAAERLGFVPAGSYAETVKAEVDWLVAAARSGDPAGVLPSPGDPYFQAWFNYAREDAWLDGLAHLPPGLP